MKIGTHNASFQCDDVMAVAMLRRLYPHATVVRTRDEAILSSCDIVVDVGGVYDHEARRYDHHQVGRAGTRENGVMYSACGLIWRHYGITICEGGQARNNIEYDLAERVVQRVDTQFVQALDATDNGQALYSGGTANFRELRGNSLSSLIASLNPAWHEPDKNFDQKFEEAVKVADLFLGRAIESARGIFLAEDIVRKAITAGYRPFPLVIELPHFCPWQEQVVQYTAEELYVIFPDEVGKFMVQCVPDKIGGFGKRKPLPAAWGGLRGAELQKLTGVSDAVFCHAGLFICGAETLEGARKLAALALV